MAAYYYSQEKWQHIFGVDGQTNELLQSKDGLIYLPML